MEKWGFLLQYQKETEILVKLLLASVCGGMIGIEREMKRRPAGLKTFSLVCIGAALIMITNEYISVELGYGGDITRMAAQIISGIGFLGAGTIIVTRQNQVKGLTTAAALWVTASIGIAIGSGFIFGGIAAVVIIYLTSMAYRYVDQKITASSRYMGLYVESTREEFFMELLKYFRSHDIKVKSLVRRPETMWYTKDSCAVIELDLHKRRDHEAIIREIKQMDEILYVEEI